MEAQRLLARMGTITVNWQNVARTTGETLRAEDIAGSLAGLARGPYLLMLYLWCKDDSVEGELYGLLLIEALHIADKNNWACKSNLTRLMAFIHTAIQEMQYENICKSCKGTGSKVLEVCKFCNGGGKKKRSQSELACSCGVKASNWKKYWAHKFQEIYLHLLRWNDMGIQHMISRLYVLDEV